MKSSLNQNAKLLAAADIVIHKRRAKQFYSKIKYVPEMCNNRTDIMAISFDFMQNVQLPALPVQEMFYLRKLWLYVFNVHNLTTNKVVFYTYHEGSGKKGPNEVCTMVYKYITDKIPPEVKELHVFSDAWGCQNHNHTMIRMFLAVTMTGRFTPAQYNNLIQGAKVKAPKFLVVPLEHANFLDFKQWWLSIFKKTTNRHDKTQDFNISKFKHFQYTSEKYEYVGARPFIDSFVVGNFKLNKGGRVELPIDQAYHSMLPVKANKLVDIRKIMHYIPEEH
uniref:Uncharacterized protein LOC114330535 n=1 Tax=Diabrotica virgifera virgifera TaxID=50390 RepID=A0A6P7FIF1_DIAVI